ncbi:MAG: DUF2029 domain-containing protein [Candidatus Heimdallarchaeota archaeon]|nr:DUF2029 domain-containing protein [Candidatus Heimdallarchaeota archaeon]
MEQKRLEDNVEGSQPKSTSPQNIRLVILLGIIYTIFQALLFFLPIEPAEDYFNHINWGIGYYEDNLYPYRDFNANEYPALSVWGWMLAYRISPNNTYEILSIIMNFPYWILAIFGGLCFYLILIEEGVSERNSVLLIVLYFFNPNNPIDTLTNHGSLGTAATFIIGLYLLRKQKMFYSAMFISAGFALKLYPIFAAPLLVWSLKSWSKRIQYSLYGLFWIIVIHIPILSDLDSYYEVLFERTTRRAGVTYSKAFENLGLLFGISSVSTYLWMLAIALTTLIMIANNKLNVLEKFSIVLMVNNLLEPRGGIGHINTVIPFMAIYFLIDNKSKFERNYFYIYLFTGAAFLYKRLIPGYQDYGVAIGIWTAILTMMTTLFFYLYLRGLHRIKGLNIDDWRIWKINVTED